VDSRSDSRFAAHDLALPGMAWGARPGIFPIDPPAVMLIGHEGEDGPAATSSEILRVLIVADDPLARAGLAALLADLPDCHVVGQVTSDAELVQVFERLDPDAVLWDAGHASALPDLTDLGEAAPPVLLLSSSEPPALRAATVGARGLLPRDVAAPTLLAALRAIARGLIVADPALATAFPPPGDRGAVSLSEPLTPREVEVLHLLAAGLPNKIIAERLRISEHTVRFHLNSIFGKLDADNRTDAVARAARLGVIVL
jgi:two-component system, NarL family, nitrate/nitrite response regulator NarL